MPDSLAGLRVLRVDNDREIFYGMRALLTRWHAVPLTASTVDEALALLSQSPYVALVDCLGAIDALRARGDVDAGRVADRRRQRCVETCRAATRLSGADQADQTGVAACLSGGAAAGDAGGGLRPELKRGARPSPAGAGRAASLGQDTWRGCVKSCSFCGRSHLIQITVGRWVAR